MIYPSKGDSVECLPCPDGEFTVGNIYEVKSGAGDNDTVVDGTVLKGDFIITQDDGQDAYCSYPKCLFGRWRIVNE